MKKILASLALMALAVSASAQVTSISEVDFHKVNGTKDKSVYWATGLAYAGSLGTVDGYVQGVHATGDGYMDNLHGFEFGYTVPNVALGKVSFAPRIAYGQMFNVDMGGYNGIGKYVLGSVEADYAPKDGLNTYVSYSHMKGFNDASIKSQNRVQAGADFTLTEKLTVRTGLSLIRQYGLTQRGVVTMAFYSF